MGLGSNLSNPQHQVELGIESLKTLPQSKFIKQSSLYLAPAMGNSMQPDFVNAVVEIETDMLAVQLLEALLKIEREHGRVRDGTRWGPRILDLDILLYDNQQIHLPLLRIPHPGLVERAFALIPLLEIAPKVCLPDGKPLAGYLAKLSKVGIKRLS
ncbi:MAG: 2-amino-4-hydroxy-6-hydroxymethyldihydropteridine diphosphokinase [Gammaproteobacteria bacterium]